MSLRGLSRPLCFFLMIRRPPRSTLDRSSAASDVYKRQDHDRAGNPNDRYRLSERCEYRPEAGDDDRHDEAEAMFVGPVSYTHLRAHETVLDLVCRLLLEKKNIHRYTL